MATRINGSNASKGLKAEPGTYLVLTKTVIFKKLLISQWKVVRQITIRYLHKKQFMNCWGMEGFGQIFSWGSSLSCAGQYCHSYSMQERSRHSNVEIWGKSQTPKTMLFPLPMLTSYNDFFRSFSWRCLPLRGLWNLGLCMRTERIGHVTPRFMTPDNHIYIMQ